MSKWNVIVSASPGYCPGASAFLNSFKHYHDVTKYRVYLLSYQLPEEFIHHDWGMDLEVIPISHPKGNIWACKIERFRVACEVGGIVGLFDADMFFCGNISNYFRIADKAGLIVGGANGSNYRFGAHWEPKYKIKNIPEIYDTKTITSVPTFMDMAVHGQIWKDIYVHKEKIGTGADFDLLNLFCMIHGKLPDIFTIPTQQVTGVHHFQIKPDTRIIKKENRLVTNDGLEVKIIHGKWWSGDWVHNLIRPLAKHCARLGATSQKCLCFQGAIKSRTTSKEEFDRWCSWPYESTLKDATIKKVADEINLYLPEEQQK